jgi:hypothetical protein
LEFPTRVWLRELRCRVADTDRLLPEPASLTNL